MDKNVRNMDVIKAVLLKCRYIQGLIRTSRLSFLHMGKKVVIGKEPFLKGAQYIEIGNNSSLGDYLVLTAWDCYHADVIQKFTPTIKIGNNCSFGSWNHITSINKIEIGDGCLTGKWVTITDHAHGACYLDDLKREPIKRNLHSKGPVIIGNNVWIGDKATILPNVKIGNGAVIGANSVVTKDVPPYAVVAGNPAVIIRKSDED